MPTSPDPARESAARWWMVYAVAAATFVPAIRFHYVGEEAIFPLTSLEMRHAGVWVEQLLFGGDLQHNPLYNWLIIPLAALVGWEHMLAVARSITIGATVGTGLVLAWACNALYRDAAFAAFAAVVYLTLADVFFYRGWLAYVDPLFAFFLFGSVACLWVACERRSGGLLALAGLALTGAFMAKALTAYVFYATALLVLCTHREYRTFLLAWPSWVVHLTAAAFPLVWFALVPANVGQGGRMFAEIVAKLAPTSLGQYALKLVAYPADTAARLAPALFVAAYYRWRIRGSGVALIDPQARTALWIAVLGYLPYWLAPYSSIRYLMPLYPLAGLVIARALWLAGGRVPIVARRWLVAAIVVKLIAVTALFPWYQKQYRGENYETAAHDILRRAAGHPLYTLNVTASGLSVAAHVNVRRHPAAPITFPPAKYESAFVIAYEPDDRVGRVVARYRLGGTELLLLCRGAACDAEGGQPPGASGR